MNKKLIGLGATLATLIALYCGVSGWLGIRIESQSYAAIDAINLELARTWSDQVRLTREEHDRGIFSSHTTYLLSLPSTTDSASASKREIRFVNHTNHGPFPLAGLAAGQFKPAAALIQTSLSVTPWTESLFKATQERSFLTGQTHISLEGVATMRWSALPFDFRQDAVRTQFGGAQLSMEISPKFRARKGALTIEAFNVTDGHATVDLKAIKITTDSRSGPGGLTLGLAKREVGSFTWSSTTAPTIQLQKLVMRHELKLKDSGVEGETHVNIDALSIAQNKLGTLKLDAFYDQLDERALEPLLSLYKRNLVHAAVNILDVQPIAPAEIKKLWQYAHGLLKNSPNIRIEPLVWETTQGKSQLSLNADLKPAELTASGRGFRTSPIDTLEATVTLSQPMIEGLVLQKFQTSTTSEAQAKILANREVKKLLDTAFQLKLGRPQEGKIVAHFNVQDAKLRINGQRAVAEPLTKLLSTFVPPNWFSLNPASGQETPDEAVAIQHLDPDVVSAILSRSDFTYETSRDADGDLTLKVAPGESGAKAIDIVFIGCRKDPTCEDILLRATYASDQGNALPFVNDWNLRNRWGRAFIGEMNAPILEMDISAYGGIGQDAIESLVSTFFDLVRNFSKELKETTLKTAPVDALAPTGTDKN